MGCSSRSLLTSIHQEMELREIQIHQQFVLLDHKRETCLRFVTSTPTHTYTHTTSKRDGKRDGACVGTVQVYHFRPYITFRSWPFCDGRSCYRSGMQTKRTFSFALKTDGNDLSWTKLHQATQRISRGHQSTLNFTSLKSAENNFFPGPVRQVTSSGSGCSVQL